MNQYFRDYLYDKNILVAMGAEQSPDYAAVAFALAKTFSMVITKGEKYANLEIYTYLAEKFAVFVPEAFYRGFPDSVLSLTKEAAAFDQFVHYIRTYGFGEFSVPGHSIFESDIKRTVFGESVVPRPFIILNEEEAAAELREIAISLLSGTRPLSYGLFEFVVKYIEAYGKPEVDLKSRSTAVRLTSALRDLDFAKTLKMSNLPALVGDIQFNDTKRDNIKKLNLKNKDRVFISAFIDKMFEDGKVDTKECYEKKKVFAGILHHIHYKPKSREAEKFLAAMRGDANLSVWSVFEDKMSKGDIEGAVGYLAKEKGPSAVLRNLNYILSRCKNEDELKAVFNHVNTKNVPLLIQLLINYSNHKESSAPRTFSFSKYSRLVKHTETDEEKRARKSQISKNDAKILAVIIRERLAEVLSGTEGKVFIDPDMKKIALPISESTAMVGEGILPKGSRVKIECENDSAKKLRAFIYWSKVNDIDLSATGYSARGRLVKKFYWYTMSELNDECIVFSGDQTAGYNGGSEYFDINLEKFRNDYSEIRYLVFAATVYSARPFAECECRSGYMFRDIDDSGEVYEPATVKSAFTINADSTNCYTYAIDLKTNELVWLNLVDKTMRSVAVAEDFAYVLDYLKATSIINFFDFFKMLSTEVVTSPEEADLIVSDVPEHHLEGKRIIRSCDFDKVIGYIG